MLFIIDLSSEFEKRIANTARGYIIAKRNLDQRLNLSLMFILKLYPKEKSLAIYFSIRAIIYLVIPGTLLARKVLKIGPKWLWGRFNLEKEDNQS